MSKYTLEVELTDEEVRALKQDVNAQIAYEKANGKDATWTIEDELLNIISVYFGIRLSGGASHEAVE